MPSRPNRRSRGIALMVVVLLGLIAAGVYVGYLKSKCRAPFSCGDLASVHAAAVVDPLALAGAQTEGVWTATDAGRAVAHINAAGVVDRRFAAPLPGAGPVIRISAGGGELLVQQEGAQALTATSGRALHRAPYGGDAAFWSDGRWWVQGTAELYSFDGRGGDARTIALPGSASFRLAGVAHGVAWVVALRGFGNSVFLELLRVDGATGRVTTMLRVSNTGIVGSNQPVLGGGSVWLGTERFDASSRALRGGERIGQFQLAPLRYIDHSDPTGQHCVSDQAWSPSGVLWTICSSGGHQRIARIRPGTPSDPTLGITGSSSIHARVFTHISVDGHGRAWYVASNGRAVGYGPGSGGAIYAPGAPKPTRSPRVAIGALLVAAAVLLWWLWFVVQRARLRRRRHLPDAAAPTMDLGPEPPAVVNLLVHAGSVTADAVPATLLDLAARRYIEVFDATPDQPACRLRPAGAARGNDPLTPYEQQVYDVVRDVAKDGSVPVRSLSAAMHPESAGFWNVFRARVRKDARTRGLVGGHFALHGLSALVPQVLLVVGLTAMVPAGVIVWLPLGLALWVVSVVLAANGTANILSGEGRAAASRWLGVRDFVARDDAFHSLPPAAVAVWDRYLSYAAAMGTAKDAARGLLLAFRTTSSHADREHAMAMLHDPFGAIAAMPADLRPDSLKGFGAAEPFGPAGGDFVALARGLLDGAPGVAAEAASGAPPARQAELAAIVRKRLDDLDAAAPDELRADVHKVHGALTTALGDVLQVGLSSREELEGVGERASAAMEQPDVAQSWGRVAHYLAEHGVGATPAPDTAKSRTPR